MDLLVVGYFKNPPTLIDICICPHIITLGWRPGSSNPSPWEPFGYVMKITLMKSLTICARSSNWMDTLVNKFWGPSTILVSTSFQTLSLRLLPPPVSPPYLTLKAYLKKILRYFVGNVFKLHSNLLPPWNFKPLPWRTPKTFFLSPEYTKLCVIVMFLTLVRCIGHLARESRNGVDIKHDQIIKSSLVEHSFPPSITNVLRTPRLSKEDNFFKQKIKEAIKISNHPSNLSRDEGRMLSSSWHPLLSFLGSSNLFP